MSDDFVFRSCQGCGAIVGVSAQEGQPGIDNTGTHLRWHEQQNGNFAAVKKVAEKCAEAIALIARRLPD